MLLLIILLKVSVSLKTVAATQIFCENFAITGWNIPLNRIRTCWMDKMTTIDSKETTIGLTPWNRNETFEGLSFWTNKKIKFLPIQVSEKFPNLLGYQASHCSITEISKKNFEGLTKLKLLHLINNKIEKILSDTFEDLVELTNVTLGKNI
jgi:Leucine rich repeat